MYRIVDHFHVEFHSFDKSLVLVIVKVKINQDYHRNLQNEMIY